MINCACLHDCSWRVLLTYVLLVFRVRVPSQGNSFIAFIASVLNIIFKKEKHAQLLTRVLGGALLGGGDFLDFVIDSYTPTLRKAYEAVGVKPCIGTRIRLFSMFLGTFIKVVSATPSVTKQRTSTSHSHQMAFGRHTLSFSKKKFLM